MAHGPKLHWLSDGGGVKGGKGRCRGNYGREGGVGDIYGGYEGRINIRRREGCVGERYEGGQEGGQI